MAARKLTDKQEAELCRLYLAGSSILKLANKYNVGRKCIDNALKRNNITKRSLEEVRFCLNSTEENQVCERYIGGDSSATLAVAYGVSKQAVLNILARHDIPTRTRGHYAKKLPASAEERICKLYLEGVGAPQIGREYGVGCSVVYRILDDHNIARRKFREAMSDLRVEDDAEICERYIQGEGVCPIGKAYGVAASTILRILEDNGIARRSIREASGGLSSSVAAEVCSRYLEGMSSHQLSKLYGVHPSTIINTLRYNDISPRSKIEARGGLNPEAEAEVCKRYLDGEHTTQLACYYEVDPTTVISILARNGVERRQAGGGQDSVQHVLDKTGSHEQERECEFYVYELSRYANTHCKPGISFNAELRADGEYGEAALRVLLTSRAEAYFLEQAVLTNTEHYADCPNDLYGWAGCSEVRSMSTKELLPIALHFIEELENHGLWEFAARYVPMTEAQRKKCLRRAALQEAA